MECFITSFYRISQHIWLVTNLSSSILGWFFPTATLSRAVPSCWLETISGVQSKLLQSFAPLTVFSSGCYHLLSLPFVTFCLRLREDLLPSGCHWCSVTIGSPLSQCQTIDIGMMLDYLLSLNIVICSFTPQLFEGLGLFTLNIPAKVIILPREEHQLNERHNGTAIMTLFFFLIANP